MKRSDKFAKKIRTDETTDHRNDVISTTLPGGTSTYQAMNETLYMWLDKIQDFFYQRFLKLQLNSLG